MSRRGRGLPAWPALSLSLAVGGAAGACSTLADTPDPEECRTDADCVEGYVCAVDQGRCLPGNEAAPRAHLGFDIRERAAGIVRFRVEVDGCDCTIDEEENIRELALRRSRVSQMFSLAATVPAPPPDDLLPAIFELTQASRFGQDPSPQRGAIEHPTLAADTMAKLDWPRYHPLDQDVPPDLVLWEVKPTGNLASRYLGLLPPRTDAMKPCTVDADCCEPRGDCNPAPNFCDTAVGECTAVGQPEWTYQYAYERACSSLFEGDVVSIDLDEGSRSALAGATVRLRYADGTDERLGIPVFGDVPAADRPPQCDDDDDCEIPDTYCDLTTQQCFVALSGRPANRSSTITEEATGTFRTQVYTYCEGVFDESFGRRYALTVQPTGPQPSVDFIIDASFPPPSVSSSGFLVGNDLCVPDWGAGVPLELAFVGQPRALAGTDDEYTCCDVACLPATAEDVSAGAPSAPASCDGRSSVGPVRLESHFVLDDVALAQWAEADCATPNPDPKGRVGSLVRTASCATPGVPCRAEDVALGTAQAPRRYDVRVESESGSVLASGDFVVEIGPEAPPVQTLTLSPRVLVTGIVDVDSAVCARRPTGEDCAAREAGVVAERLRLPNEADGSVPGPYLHYVSTFFDPVTQRDGAFVLPLDPGGVYLVTALPPAGAEGGPAGYALVDLRADAPPLEPLRLVLEDGVVVTLRLDQFDPRTVVIPLDRGSYLAPGKTLYLPGSDTPIDLDEIGACWTPPLEGPQACKIRRLIPPGSDLARSQVGVVRFTARRSDAAQCPVRCPMSPPADQ